MKIRLGSRYIMDFKTILLYTLNNLPCVGLYTLHYDILLLIFAFHVRFESK